MNPPNLITFLRIAAVPLMVWLILEAHIVGAFWVFIAAGVSDALDGYIAKRFNMETQLGVYLDPIADKAMLMSVFVTLGLAGYLPSWLVILVVFRDLGIIAGALLFETLIREHWEQRPLMVSKINTTLQIVLAGTVLGHEGYGLGLEMPITVLVWMTATTTVLSGVAYVMIWSRRWAKMEEDHE